jgi:ubiquinone/menaquinone biosynthesis C-methylase UbiE
MIYDEEKDNWFGDWANEYDQTIGKLKRHHDLLDLVVEQSHVKSNIAILDIGCGTGLLALKFLKKSDCHITAIDSSQEMLDIIEKKVKRFELNEKILCQHEDLEDIEFDEGTFDIITSTFSLHHIKGKYTMIEKIFRMLKPGGRLIIGEIDLDTTGDVRDPKRLMRIMEYLKIEFSLALEEGGVNAFSRMYDNGKKHILNDGEYCISFKQWELICQKANFSTINIQSVPDFEWFKVLTAVK